MKPDTLVPPQLVLTDLDQRHPGVSPGFGLSLLEAASICLDRHHTPPTSISVRAEWAKENTYGVGWPVPTTAVRASYDDERPTTEAGAYCVTIAAAEVHLGLYVVKRLKQGTGADFLVVGPPGSGVNPVDGQLDLDQENVYRLEVSGINSCEDDAPILRRLTEKINQTKRGSAFEPAIAGVVGFSTPRLIFRKG